MKIEATDLRKAVLWALKDTDLRSDKPAVGLVCKDGQVRFVSTGSHSYFSAPVPSASATEDVEVVLYAPTLKNVADVVGRKAGEVDVKVGKNEVKMKSPIGQFSIPFVDVELPDIHLGSRVATLSASDFTHSLKSLSTVCNTREGATMPMLSSVLLSFGDSFVSLMSTNRYTIGKNILDAHVDEVGASFVYIPYHYTSMGYPTTGSIDVSLSEDKTALAFSFDNGYIAQFFVSSIDSPYTTDAMYGRAVENAKSSFIINLPELKFAVSSVSAIAFDETDIYLHISEDAVVVSDKAKKNKISVPISQAKLQKNMDMNFNRVVLNSAFAALNHEMVCVTINTETHPIGLRSVDDDGLILESELSITMPGAQRN